ncbi:MAG: type II toxin-antitoxin system VapC family toxin [Balneolales bacterium]
MTILDTHSWIYWVSNPELLSAKALKFLNDSSSIGLSIISCLEVALLVEKQKIELAYDIKVWMEKALSHENLEVINLTPTLLIASTQLPGNFHQDPADRIIAATCLLSNNVLITKDKKINKWGYIRTIW